jgi:hypothetical protein
MKLPSTAHIPGPWRINDAHQWKGQGEAWAAWDQVAGLSGTPRVSWMR